MVSVGAFFSRSASYTVRRARACPGLANLIRVEKGGGLKPDLRALWMIGKEPKSDRGSSIVQIRGRIRCPHFCK